jgi:hypothetical protein
LAWNDPARVLRRLEWLAGAYGVAGGALVLVLRRSVGAAVVLTLAAAASIVAFRGLQGLVGRLQAGADTETSEQRRDGGRRSRRFSRRFVWLRFALLLLVPLASLWLDSERALALVLGFSVLPLAIMTEGLLQLVYVLAPRNHGN